MDLSKNYFVFESSVSNLNISETASHILLKLVQNGAIQAPSNSQNFHSEPSKYFVQ